MIWPILFATIAVICLWNPICNWIFGTCSLYEYFIHDSGDTIFAYIITIIKSVTIMITEILVAFVAFLFGTLIASSLGNAMPTQWVLSGTIPINNCSNYSLKTNLDSEYQLNGINIDNNVSISQKIEKNAEIKIYKEKYTNPLAWLIALDYDQWWVKLLHLKGNVKYEVYLSRNNFANP